MIYFRVDGNREIGTGHMIRCLAIAEQVRSLGEECTFICADENYKAQIKSNNNFFYCLNTKWDHMDSELPVLSEFLDQRDAQVMLIDSYKVSAEYLSFLTRRLYTVYIDDLGDMVYPCSALINYNLYWDKFSYNERYIGSETQFFLGTEYTPLRREYEELTPKVFCGKNHFNILITTGGTDSGNYSGKILSALLAKLGRNGFSYTVICGKYNPFYYALIAEYNDDPCVTILSNVTDMCSLMQKSDVIVSSSGTTMFEIAATGTPAVCFILADNQIMNAEAFASCGMCLAGDIRYDKDVPQRIADQVGELVERNEERRRISLAEQKLIDGKGSRRIADILVAGLHHK